MAKKKKEFSDQLLKEIIDRKEAQQGALKKILKGIEKNDQSKKN